MISVYSGNLFSASCFTACLTGFLVKDRGEIDAGTRFPHQRVQIIWSCHFNEHQLHTMSFNNLCLTTLFMMPKDTTEDKHRGEQTLVPWALLS